MQAGCQTSVQMYPRKRPGFMFNPSTTRHSMTMCLKRLCKQGALLFEMGKPTAHLSII